MTEAVLKPPRANLTQFVHKPYLLVTMAGYISTLQGSIKLFLVDAKKTLSAPQGMLVLP